MNEKLKHALDFSRAAGLGDVVVCVPFPLTPEEVHTLRCEPDCKGLVLYHPSPEITATSSGAWLGCFDAQGGWSLPSARGTLLLVGSHVFFTGRMALQAIKRRRTHVFCLVNGEYQAVPLYRFVLSRLADRAYQRARVLPHGSVARRVVYGVASFPLARRAWHALLRRQPAAAGISGFESDALWHEVVQRAAAAGAASGIRPVPGRVVLVNAGLAAGGAERQVVNTLVGLKRSGRCESVALLAEYIQHARHLDFFLADVQRHGIEVAQVERQVTLASDGLSLLSPNVAEVLADLPPVLLEEILNLAQAFAQRRPEVVHAWQDGSSIKCAIAGLIAGVPTIVVGGRNVAPVHFEYVQDYMRPAYRAIAQHPQIRMLNNSQAGADSYAGWIGIEPSRIVVLRNGVDLADLRHGGEQAAKEFLDGHGLDPAKPVVGSVFRFWPEKRPMLWLQAMDAVARRRADVQFLLVGEGVMRAEMEEYVQGSALAGRLRMPGARPDVAVPLTAMDLFVLTSKYEGTPNVVLEAQWLGLPVVATDSGGTREAFDIGVSGFLADPAEPDVIATRVLDWLGNPDRMVQAREAGPKFVADRFGLARMVDETLALYGLKGT